MTAPVLDPPVTVPAPPPLVNVYGVELIHTGTWDISTGEWTATPEDLQAAVAALDCPAIRRPVLKVGHTDPRFDGEPAFGWVGNLHVEQGRTLVGDYMGMPAWMAAKDQAGNSVLSSAWPDRSIEGLYDFRCQIGHTHPFILEAVAFLGVTPPGVGTLQSLQDVAIAYGVSAGGEPAGSGTRIAVRVPASRVAAAAQVHDGAMIALVPTPADAARLAVEGGEPEEQLHLTLYFLGQADQYTPDVRASIVNAVTSMVDRRAIGPVKANAFSVAMFNPNGEKPCVVLGVGDVPDAEDQALGVVRGDISEAWYDGMLPVELPEQRTPWLPHVTLAYTDEPAMVGKLADRTGPIVFDRIRVAFAGEATDIPLVAAAPEVTVSPATVEATRGRQLVLAAWLESEHPRYDNGRFAEKLDVFRFDLGRGASAEATLFETGHVGLEIRQGDVEARIMLSPNDTDELIDNLRGDLDEGTGVDTGDDGWLDIQVDGDELNISSPGAEILVDPVDAGVLADWLDLVRTRYEGDDPDDEDSDAAPSGLVATGKDKLKVGSRIKLAPGEAVAGSERVSVGDHNEILLALLDTPDGPELRVGVTNEENDGRWRASNTGTTVRLDSTGISQWRTTVDEMATAGKEGEAREAALRSQIEALGARIRDLRSKQHPNLTDAELAELDDIEFDLRINVEPAIARRERWQQEMVDALSSEARVEWDRIDGEIATIRERQDALLDQAVAAGGWNEAPGTVDEYGALRDQVVALWDEQFALLDSDALSTQDRARLDAIEGEIATLKVEREAVLDEVRDTAGGWDDVPGAARRYSDLSVQIQTLLDERDNLRGGRNADLYRGRQDHIADLVNRRAVLLARRVELTADPVLLLEQEAADLAEATAERIRLEDEHGELVDGGVVATGVIPGLWGDLVWRVDMDDEPSAGYDIVIRPADAGPDWDIYDDAIGNEDQASFNGAADFRKLAKALDTLIGLIDTGGVAAGRWICAADWDESKHRRDHNSGRFVEMLGSYNIPIGNGSATAALFSDGSVGIEFTNDPENVEGGGDRAVVVLSNEAADQLVNDVRVDGQANVNALDGSDADDLDISSDDDYTYVAVGREFGMVLPPEDWEVIADHVDQILVDYEDRRPPDLPDEDLDGGDGLPALDLPDGGDDEDELSVDDSASEREEEERLEREAEEREAAESWWEDVSIAVGDGRGNNSISMDSPTEVLIEDLNFPGVGASADIPAVDIPALTAAIRTLAARGGQLPEFEGDDEPDVVEGIKASNVHTVELLEDGELQISSYERGIGTWETAVWRDSALELADELDKLHAQIQAAQQVMASRVGRRRVRAEWLESQHPRRRDGRFAKVYDVIEFDLGRGVPVTGEANLFDNGHIGVALDDEDTGGRLRALITPQDIPPLVDAMYAMWRERDGVADPDLNGLVTDTTVDTSYGTVYVGIRDMVLDEDTDDEEHVPLLVLADWRPELAIDDSTVTLADQSNLVELDEDAMDAFARHLEDLKDYQPPQVNAADFSDEFDVALRADGMASFNDGTQDLAVFTVAQAAGILEGLQNLAGVALPEDTDDDPRPIDGFAVDGDVSLDLYSDGDVVATLPDEGGLFELNLGADIDRMIAGLEALLDNATGDTEPGDTNAANP